MSYGFHLVIVQYMNAYQYMYALIKNAPSLISINVSLNLPALLAYKKVVILNKAVINKHIYSGFLVTMKW